MPGPAPDDSPATVAVLGGGQLGRMLGLAGVPLGVAFRFLDPSPRAGAGAVGDLVVGELGDVAAARRTADGAEVVTYEWEGVPAATVEALTAPVYPPVAALRASQDRLAEKELFASVGIGTPDWAPVDSAGSLRAALRAVGEPALLKTRRGGYDGKGQWEIGVDVDVDALFAELGGTGPWILEAKVPFARELSIVAVRGRDGDTRTYPLVENRHADGILRTSRAPARETWELDDAARREVTALLDRLGYVGVLTLELFHLHGHLLANEFAPRVHNSGHWTIEGAVTSQFENHVRAVLGWPLGSTEAVGVSAMVNCIGVLPDPTAVLRVEGAHLHRYGKAPRPGRKLGHVTVVAPDAAELDARLSGLRAVLPADEG